LTPQPSSSPIEPAPRWFGPPERPLFGWLHLPRDRTVRGGVVLCQPLGIEAICVYFTYRLLADRLAEQGLAVLRFDYDGTGDSAGGETDPDRVAAWLASVTAATDELAATGVPRIGLVGIRMGGLFAAHEAARRGGVDALVLWDPCVSGRSFLRQQRFLRHLGGGGVDQEEEAVEAPGLRFEPDTVHDLAGLDLASMDGVMAKQALVLVPPGTSRPRTLDRRFEGLDVEWKEATGQEGLLDSRRQAPPLETVASVAGWLASTLQGEAVTLVEPPAASGPAVVGGTPEGLPVFEHSVTLGELGLFGIVTESGAAPRGPTIVLVNEGNTHHIGQARIWVDLARVLGAAGFRILRFDLSGNGDSGTRPGQLAHVSRAPEAIEDVYVAMGSISPDDPTDVVLVGFCSGAYQVIEQALLHPPRGVCVINPAFAFVPPEPEGTAERQARQRSKRWLVHLAGPPLHRLVRTRNPTEAERWVTALDNGTWPVAMAKRRPGIPESVWRFVSRHLLDNTGTTILKRVVESEIDTFVVCGSDDYLPIRIGSDDQIRLLEQAPNFHLEVLSDLDHASWAMAHRKRLVASIAGHLQRAYCSPAPGSASSAPHA
jgi:alpha-beta hydrolase superfamily lysophospholipase